MGEFDDIEVDYGPDSDRETELKRELAALVKRYQQEAKPLIDELTRHNCLKAPRVFLRTMGGKREEVA